MFMAMVAGRTSKIRIGSSISILPLHHPLQVAEDYAMVDVASRGRLEFGIGMGNTPIDFEHYGIAREDSRERRLAQIAQRKVAPWPVRVEGGRPTKRDRRLIHRFTGE